MKRVKVELNTRRLMLSLRKNQLVRSLYFRFNDWLSRQQGTQIVNLFGHQLKLPSRHPLAAMFLASPRDALLVELAKASFSKELNHYVDVGANVGDTAVIVEHFSKVKLSSDLIEPSKFFFPFLVENSKLLHNAVLHQKFASTTHPATDLTGILYHWPGNAEFVDVTSNLLAGVQDQVNLGELIKIETALVKVDCEGLDVSILEAGVSLNSEATPIYYFESTLRSEADYSRLQNLFLRLGSNYDRVIVACPAGLLLYGGEINENFWRLATFQLNLQLLGQRERLYYVDIAVFPNARKQAYETALLGMETSGKLSNP